MIRASITPGMARTRFSRSSESMVAPTILCRRSECRGSTVGAGLRIPRFPRRPPGTCCPSEDQDVIAIRLDPEHLVTSGDGLPRRKAEHLAGRSPDLQLLPVLIPKCRHHSLHYDCLLFRQKTTFVAAGELQIYRGRVSRNPRRNNLAGYTAPALPMLSKTFRQVRKTGNSRMEWRYLPGAKKPSTDRKS